MGCTNVWGVYICIGITDIWGCAGAYRCIGDKQRVYRCMGCVEMYGGVYRCIGHRDIRLDVWDVQTHRRHTDVWGSLHKCRANRHIGGVWGVQTYSRVYRYMGAY